MKKVNNTLKSIKLAEKDIAHFGDPLEMFKNLIETNKASLKILKEEENELKESNLKSNTLISELKFEVKTEGQKLDKLLVEKDIFDHLIMHEPNNKSMFDYKHDNEMHKKEELPNTCQSKESAQCTEMAVPLY